MPAKPPAEPSFEEALETLENLIAQIESGDVGLEEAIGRYEEGAKLVARCRGILDRAETRIRELTTGADGGLEAGEPA